MADLSTDVLVVGSGAGEAFTAAALAGAGRTVMVLEEARESIPTPTGVLARRDGRRVPPPRGRRGHQQPSSPTPRGAAWGQHPEINSGLYHPRLPDHLAAEWQVRYAIDEFAAPALAAYADRVEPTST